MPFLARELPPGYTPRRLSDTEMQQLEERLARSTDATPHARRVIIWALRQTDHGTRAVALSLPEGTDGRTSEVQHGAHDLVSRNGTTQLPTILEDLRTHFGLSHHQGGFSVTQGTRTFASSPYERTIWWSSVYYDRRAALLPVPTDEELAQIVLP